jgi:hypothetical protein
MVVTKIVGFYMKITKEAVRSGKIIIYPYALYMEVDIPELHMPIALNLTIMPETHFAWWGDTLRGHVVNYENYEISDDKVIITDRRGYAWSFQPLTLALFNEKASPYLTPMTQPFKSDEEVQKYYEESLFLFV